MPAFQPSTPAHEKPEVAVNTSVRPEPEKNPLNTSFFESKSSLKHSPDLSPEKKVEQNDSREVKSDKKYEMSECKRELAFGTLWGTLFALDIARGYTGLACLTGGLCALSLMRSLYYYRKSTSTS